MTMSGLPRAEYCKNRPCRFPEHVSSRWPQHSPNAVFSCRFLLIKLHPWPAYINTASLSLG